VGHPFSLEVRGLKNDDWWWRCEGRNHSTSK
jgi:hypothetical protein